jgi:hypothetical protein
VVAKAAHGIVRERRYDSPAGWRVVNDIATHTAGTGMSMWMPKKRIDAEGQQDSREMRERECDHI